MWDYQRDLDSFPNNNALSLYFLLELILLLAVLHTFWEPSNSGLCSGILYCMLLVKCCYLRSIMTIFDQKTYLEYFEKNTNFRYIIAVWSFQYCAHLPSLEVGLILLRKHFCVGCWCPGVTTEITQHSWFTLFPRLYKISLLAIHLDQLAYYWVMYVLL